jgi:predicted Zn-dependent peptidase
VQSPDRYELEVLASILGGGMSSRLFSEVREKRGLAYYVRSSSDEYKDTGSLVSTAGIDPKRVKEAVEVMMQEYQKVASGTMKITEKELKKAKEYIKGHLVLELEDSRAVSTFYAHQELVEDEILNPDEVLKKVDNVTIEQVESVGQKYFVNEGLNLALIGNFSEKDALEKVLTVR